MWRYAAGARSPDARIIGKGFTDYAFEISVINIPININVLCTDTLKEEYTIILFIHLLLKDASRATCDSVKKNTTHFIYLSN